MKKQTILYLLIVASVIAAGAWFLSEPDYSITYVPQDQRESEVAAARAKVDADPSSSMNWAQLATAYLADAKASGDRKLLELAKEAADHVLQADSPYRKNALLVLAEVAHAQGDFAHAFQHLETITRENPSDVDSLGLRANVLAKLGRYRESLAAAISLAQAKPSSSSFRLRGQAREAVGEVEGAERDLIAAIGMESKTNPAEALDNREALARFYIHTRDFDRARRVLASALKISESARFNGLLGQIELAENHFDAARAAFDRAFQEARDPVWLVEQAKVERARKREDSFRSSIDLALELLKAEIARGETSHRATFAEALALSGKPEELALAVKQIEEVLTTRHDIETLETAIRIATAKGDSNKANSLANELSQMRAGRAP